MNKEKLYTEEEIIELIEQIDDEHLIYFRKHFHEEFINGWVEACNRLKSKFMTPQGFRKAIKKAGLIGTQFD